MSWATMAVTSSHRGEVKKCRKKDEICWHHHILDLLCSLTLSGPGSFWAPTSGGAFRPPLPKITLGHPFWTKLGTITKFSANFQKNLIWHHLDHLWRHKLMTSLLMTSSVTSTYDFTIFDVIEWRHDDGSGHDLAKIFVSSVCNTCPSLRSFEIPSDDFWPHESSNLTLLGVPKIRGSDLIVLPKFRTGDPGWIFFCLIGSPDTFDEKSMGFWVYSWPP